uniref:response regulator transcription factor n=1 Tax=Acetatifactor sp. TaxID=1872090 RepID=UPI0040579DD1
MHTLLIVEDEKMIRQGIKAMVQRSGVQVDIILECSNGEMALDILRSQAVDVMFTDIRMPKMDGIELVKAMQDLPTKPLTVAISGFDDFSYAVEMLRAGVREYILKPVDREQIKQILEKLDIEIQKNQAKNENSRTISCQQLKHMMQNEDITETEKNAILTEYGDNFYKDGYVVCCLDNREGEMLIEEDYVYINNLGDSEAYIMKADIVEGFKMREWRRRYVGVSSFKEGLENLREAYKEALSARKEAFWTERPFLAYEEIADRDKKEPEEAISLDNYVQMLGTDKYEQALKQMRNLFWNARRKIGHGNLEVELVNFLNKLLQTYEAVLHTETIEVENMKHLYRYSCIGEYESEFMSWVEKFTTSLNHQFEDYKNKQKIQQAVLYVRDNYDKDLNMAVVSNYISMNYSLFSYAFKQYTGTNFVNFLKDIRMEKAKELLETTDLRIVEISQKIGYENEKHFMKIFKVTCGVSPTEYRRNMQYKREK